MEKNNQHSITAYQAFTLIVMSVIGVSILIVPRTVGEVAGPDGIWIIFFPLLYTMGIVYIMTKLCQRFPKKTIVEFSEEILGSKQHKWLGKVLKIPFLISFAVVWILILMYVTRGFGEVIVSTIFSRTPIDVVILTFLGVAAVVASYPPEVLAKFNELLFPFIFIPVIFLLIGFLQHGDITHLLPLFQVDWKQVLSASLEFTFNFTGYGILLMFMAYYQQPQKATKMHMYALLLAGFFYWITFVTTIGLFGVTETKNLLWPTLEIVRVIDLPFQIFQRLESGMLTLWMVASFTTVTNVYTSLVDYVYRYSKAPEYARKWISLVALPIAYFLSMIPKNVQELFTFIQVIGQYIVVIDLIIPPLLLLIAYLRKKRGESDEKTSVS